MQTAILKPATDDLIESLRVGERVRFDVYQTRRGLEAINVTAEDGGPVQGDEGLPKVGALKLLSLFLL